MSVENRRTDVVREIVVALFASGCRAIRPGDVNAVLRERNAPLGTWEVRAEFAMLEALGVIVLDPATADWLPGDLSVAQQSAG